jgi:hypothetical protein
MRDEAPDQRAARLGAWLDQPHREDTDSRLGRENRYTKMGQMQLENSLIPLAICKSCCVFVPDQDVYLDVHEQRFHV